MPRKRKDADAIPTDVETVVSEEQTGMNTKPASIKDRLSIPLNADGSIDFDSMRDKGKEKLQRALSTSGNLGTTATVTGMRVNRDFIPHMYDSMCAGIQLAGQKLFHWPAELTKGMQFTDEEKENLKEPTAKVLEKHAPAWLLSHQEEFALAQAVIVASKAMVERATLNYVLTMQGTEKPAVVSMVEGAEITS